MKKTLSLLFVLVLTLSATLPVTAEPIVDCFGDVRFSVTDSNVTGWGLGFCFDLTAAGVQKTTGDKPVLTAATVSYGGVDYPLVGMGAVVTNRPEVGEDSAALTRETVDDKRVKDIPVTKLYHADATGCTYVIRITNIPLEAEGENVYARPYVIVRNGEEEQTLYGDICFTTYADQLALYTLKTPGYGADPDGKGRIFIGDISVIQSTLYVEVQDELDDWMTQEDAWIQLVCYDAKGEPLTPTDPEAKQSELYKLYIGALSADNQTVTCSVEMPEGTAEVRIGQTMIKYWTEWEEID